MLHALVLALSITITPPTPVQPAHPELVLTCEVTTDAAGQVYLNNCEWSER